MEVAGISIGYSERNRLTRTQSLPPYTTSELDDGSARLNRSPQGIKTMLCTIFIPKHCTRPSPYSNFQIVWSLDIRLSLTSNRTVPGFDPYGQTTHPLISFTLAMAVGPQYAPSASNTCHASRPIQPIAQMRHTRLWCRFAFLHSECVLGKENFGACQIRRMY